MISSIPLSAQEFGIGFREYEEMARSVRDVRLMTRSKRNEILKLGGILLGRDVQNRAMQLLEDTCDDRGFYNLAGLPYWKGPPVGEKIFITTVIGYLLRKYFN